MQIDYFIDYKHEVVMVKPRGTLDITNLFGYEQKIESRPDVFGYTAVVDMGGVEKLIPPSSDQIRELARRFAESGTSDTGRLRLVIVAHADFMFGLARMFEIHYESITRAGDNVKVFRTLDEAAGLLRLSGEVFVESFRAPASQDSQQSSEWVDVRRSQRLLVRVPIVVRGKTADDSPFSEKTHTLNVNAFGGLMTLAAGVYLGKKLILKHEVSGEELEGSVVYVSPGAGSDGKVGIVFPNPSPFFWGVELSPEDWEQNR